MQRVGRPPRSPEGKKAFPEAVEVAFTLVRRDLRQILPAGVLEFLRKPGGKESTGVAENKPPVRVEAMRRV